MLPNLVGFDPAPRARSEAPDWQAGLPVLKGLRVTLRELRVADAATLLTMVGTDEVTRFISPPPPSVDAFERFIVWARKMRELGTHLNFAVTLRGSHTAVGIFQLRELEPEFRTAEWGFAIASEYWGTGIFTESAELVANFAFRTVGVHRLEARAVVRNGRGNGALRKIGAVQEGVLHRSFLRYGEYMDQVLWSILRDEWLERAASRSPGSTIH